MNTGVMKKLKHLFWIGLAVSILAGCGGGGNGSGGIGGGAQTVDMDKVYFFVARDSVDIKGNNCIYATDGTSAGTFLVKSNILSNVSQLKGENLYAGKIYFAGGEYDDADPDVQLWVSDGTSAGTKLFKKLNNDYSSYPNYFTQMNGLLFFIAEDGSYDRLWVTDGTAAGTRVINNASGDILDVKNHLKPVVAGNALYFFAADAAHGFELWKTDGSQAGTVLVKDISPGSGDSGPLELTVYGNKVFFSCSVGVKTNLWVSDGTEAGTKILVKTRSDGDDNVSQLFASSTGLLFFRARNESNYEHLWVSNGAQDNATEIVLDGPTVSSYPQGFTEAGGLVYFVAFDNTHGYELWVSNGTQAGTRMVKDIRPGTDGANLNSLRLKAMGNKIYFAADDGISGKELWVSDGTEAGTVRVKDIYAGLFSSDAYLLKALNNKLIFIARDGTYGYEPWVSDGTEAGSIMLKDILSGDAGSFYF